MHFAEVITETFSRDTSSPVGIAHDYVARITSLILKRFTKQMAIKDFLSNVDCIKKSSRATQNIGYFLGIR